MKWCSNCGIELADDAMFCASCGTPVAEQPAPEQAVPQQEYIPQQQAYAPQQEYVPQQQAYAPQQEYVPQQQAYAPQQGYAPQQQAYAPQQQAYQQPSALDVPSTGMNILCFFIPLIGLILYLTEKDKFPIKAKSMGKWALIGFIVNMVLSVLMTVIPIVIALLSSGMYYY